MTRTQGWEDRLAAVLAAAQDAPYVLGQTDCLRLACASVEALTGVDLWPQFAGYQTKREALITIRRHAPTLAGAVSSVLGLPCQPIAVARRGDVCLYHDREDHLGVCTGPRVVVTTDRGLVHAPLSHPGLRGCWRVG